MSSQVFISHSSKDKVVGDAACAILEQRGYRCWIAPRDIEPGTEWGEAIMNGLTACRVFVLIFSANANESPQVRRELERAVHHGLVVIPFRIEDVAPHRAMEYFMSVPHWLDAMTPPLEQHLDELAEVVARLLEDPDAKHDFVPAPAQRRINTHLAAAVTAFLVAVPVLASFGSFDPPWPSGLGYGSALLVAGGTAWPHFSASGGQWLSTNRLRAIAAGLVIAAIAYLALLSLFVETIPGTGVRVVKGFVCTPDALLVYGERCPNLGRDALRDAEWEAPTLWTGPSLMAVRLSLALSWLMLVAGLTLAAARIQRLSLADEGRVQR